jgi:hypothetical protein
MASASSARFRFLLSRSRARRSSFFDSIAARFTSFFCWFFDSGNAAGGISEVLAMGPASVI